MHHDDIKFDIKEYNCLVTVTFKRLKKYVIFFKSETHIHVIFIDGKISILVIKLSIGMY